LVSLFFSVFAGLLSDFEDGEEESEDEPAFSELLDELSDRSAFRRDNEGRGTVG